MKVPLMNTARLAQLYISSFFPLPSVASIVSNDHVTRSMYLSRYAEGAQICASQGLAQYNQVIPESFPRGEIIIQAIGSWV